MKLSAFSINTIFIVLMLLGIAIIPQITLQLMPSPRSNQLNVAFTWPNANAELLEIEVTSKLEGAFSRTKGLKNISSQTSQGHGTIQLVIDKNEDINAVKLHLSSVIHSLVKNLPQDVTIGQIQESGYKRQEDKSSYQLLLNYTITGPGTTSDVATFAEDKIVPSLTNLSGIAEVSVTGALPFEWVLLYDPEKLQTLQLTPQDIAQAINTFYSRKEGGKVMLNTTPHEEYAYLVFKGNPSADKITLLDIPISTIQGKIIYLKNIATLDYQETKPNSYYRINGLNRININIFCEKKSNMLDLASQVKTKMQEIKAIIPPTYSIQVILDNSEELKDELGDNLVRTGLTVLILLLFVYLTSRSFRYLLIVFVCLSANLFIALLFYCFFEIELHLYSLAGITISFGIIIDNVIVMADHYRHHKNRHVFMAILAATLTTMGALVVMFNMDHQVMQNMWGFSAVIIINLTISILIALFFVPALMDKLPLREIEYSFRYHRFRKIVRFNQQYKRSIYFLYRYKIIFFIFILLSFGLPTFLIPTTIESNKPWAEVYNRLFNNEFFYKIKPWLDRGLGGTLRLFIEGGSGEWRKKDPAEEEKTALILRMNMPHGATLEQMNEAFIKIEQFLTRFNEIDVFTSDIRSINQAVMKITFLPEKEFGEAPELIKNELIRFVHFIGNASCSVEGVGKAFSNQINEFSSEALKVVGYNYKQVMSYAEQLIDTLKNYQRIKNPYIGQVRNEKRSIEFTVNVNKELLARNQSDMQHMLSYFNQLAGSKDIQVSTVINSSNSRLVIRPEGRQVPSLWELQNNPIQGNGSVFKLQDVGSIEEKQALEAIRKSNQEYEVQVQYDYLGDYSLSQKFKERLIKKMNQEMAIGFRLKEGGQRGFFHWKGMGGMDQRIWYILLIITILFFICAILLESLKQALIVITIAPLSFIGCFLGFYFIGLQFNEGGLAAFIMMCGLSVNSILYIINDYNNKVKTGSPHGLSTYLRAYHAKIIPILLTVISTVLGFIPFIIGNVSDFWFSLAVGTISGLLFSLFVLIFVLPIMFVSVREMNFIIKRK